eukprot:236868-Hanusia_phi.AAC.2
MCESDVLSQVVIGDAESLLKVSEAGTLRTGSLRFLVVDEVKHDSAAAAAASSRILCFPCCNCAQQTSKSIPYFEESCVGRGTGVVEQTSACKSLTVVLLEENCVCKRYCQVPSAFLAG